MRELSKMDNPKVLFDSVSDRCSKLVTSTYSTSFSLAIRFLHKDFEKPIHGIYGFVRLADEIVDSFHDYQKKELLTRFTNDTYLAIEEGISLNPILHSFQQVVNNYGIDRELIRFARHGAWTSEERVQPKKYEAIFWALLKS